MRQRREKMTRNQKMAMAEKRIQNIYDNLLKEFPNIEILGVTKEQKQITKKVHASMWLDAFEKKPGKYKEADEFIRNIIICSALMIDLGVVKKEAKLFAGH